LGTQEEILESKKIITNLTRILERGNANAWNAKKGVKRMQEQGTRKE